MSMIVLPEHGLSIHADIHGHLFFEVDINQQDKYIRIVAGHFDVRVTTFTWCNLN